MVNHKIFVIISHVKIAKIHEKNSVIIDLENIFFHHLAMPKPSPFIVLLKGEISIAQIKTSIELFSNQNTQIVAESPSCHQYKAHHFDDSFIFVAINSFSSSDNSKSSIWLKKDLSSFFSNS
ncbi:MAG: hypothetical protein LBU14_02705 [Candidatus Peribacteria bacterium]|jgi:hypothetical protein|nr:hypothetical protein [Candidatus Peribacteria bacterium]